MSHQTGWLLNDFDARDPKDALHDIETGAWMDALGTVSPLIRMLMQDSDFRVEVQQDEHDVYFITKIVKKRNPEYVKGTPIYWVHDNEGNRIPLEEEEYDKLLSIKHDPEDVYEAEGLDLTTLETDTTAPMDPWDVIWDSTDVLSATEKLKNTYIWDELSQEQQDQELEWLRDGMHPEYPDVKEYSANYFYTHTDKRGISPKAAQIAKDIKETGLSRGQLARVLSEPGKVDLRPEKAQRCRADAAKLPAGKEKARLLLQAQAMMKCYFRSQKAMRLKKQQSSTISASDKRVLWAIWRDQELRVHGKVELTQWQYERGLYANLRRSGVDHDAARDRVRAAVKKLYNSDRIGRLVPYEAKKLTETNRPAWLR